jgi:hypothetical protein
LHYNENRRQESTNPSFPSINDIVVKNDRITPIDTLTIDKYSRLTLTKKFKKIFSLNPKDKIVVYQETYTKNIILKVRHDEVTVSNWILTKSKDHLTINNVNVHFKNKSFNKNNDLIDDSNYDKFSIKERDSKIKNIRSLA